MYILKTVVRWGWFPTLITVLAVIGSINGWDMKVLAIVLVIILLIGLAMIAVFAREKELERSSLGLKELAGYFSRRFAGTSSLSIFAIINSLFSTDNPKLWDWARACDMAQRLFNTWCNSFINRVESDIKTRRFTVYLHTYLTELWLINNHYHEFIEQFYEIATKVEMPREAIEQYNRFVMEYNAFAQHFRDLITELRRVAKTEIETPSVKVARELEAGSQASRYTTSDNNQKMAEQGDRDETSR